MEKIDLTIFGKSIERLSELFLKLKNGERLTYQEEIDYNNIIDSLKRFLPVSGWI